MVTDLLGVHVPKYLCATSVHGARQTPRAET